MFGRISIVFVSLLVYFVAAQEIATAPAETKASDDGTTGDVIKVPTCDKTCFDECTLKDIGITECGALCSCEAEAEQLTTDLVKDSRCWMQCRQDCILDIFTEDSEENFGQSNCFGECACVCNRQCTQSCTSSKSKTNKFCLQSCGCPSNKKRSDLLLKKQKEYFDLPLDNKTDDELAQEFAGKIADLVTHKDTEKQTKERQVLDKKLRKIERKWDEYAENAKNLGINATVFCNQTCSHDCFLEADQSTYEVLTKCLISKCQCFRPKLPDAKDYISFESLIVLKNIITEEEEKSEQVADAYEQISKEYEHQVDKLDDTADLIDEIIEDTIKAANTTTSEEEPIVPEEPTPQRPDTPTEESQPTPVEEPKAEETSPANSTEPVTPVVPEDTPAAPTNNTETATPTEEPATPTEEPATPTEESATPAEEPVAPVVPEDTPTNKTEPATPSEEAPATPEEKPTTPEETPVTPEETPVKPEEQPVTPEEQPVTPEETPSHNQTHSEILDTVTKKAQNCNLTCFDECLDLKKYVPYPAIEQCVDLRCHCSFNAITSNVQSLLSTTSNEDIMAQMRLSAQEKPTSSIFGAFVMFLLITVATLGVAYLVYRYIGQNNKRRAYSDYGVSDSQAYERLA